MGKQKRRSFSDEYKAETVRLVRDSGKTVGAVARELGLTETALRRWVEQAKPGGAETPVSVLTREEREELGQLRREVRTLRMERDILKKATAFFAREST